MDIVAWDDPKVCRGIEILQGKVEDHTQINALRAKPDEVAGDEDELKPSDKLRGKDDKAALKQAPARKPCGLELGRRLLIVLKAPAEPGDKSSSGSGSGSASGPRSKGSRVQAVRVVDHGATQKEAVRRLFDAQVLLRSYEEQLQEKEREVKALHFALKEKRTKQQQMRNEAENVEVRPEEEKKEATQTAASKAFYLDGADGKVTIPYWLRNDERSRLNVDRLKNVLIGLIQLKGERVEAIEISDALWEVGMQFALRWAGSPDDEVLKQNQAMKEKFMTIQKQAMQETAMLRQHIKRVEFKYRELQNNAKQLKAALQSAVSFASQLHRSLAALQAQQPQQVVHHWQPRGEVRNEKPLNPTAQSIVAGWMRSTSPTEAPPRAQEAATPTSPGIAPPTQGFGLQGPPPPPPAAQPSADAARAGQAAQRAMEAAQRGQALLAEVSAMAPVPAHPGGYAQGPFAGGGAPASWGPPGGGGLPAAAFAGGYGGGYGPGGGGYPGSPKTLGGTLPSLAGLGATPATHYDYDQGLPGGPTFAETYAAFTGGQSTLSLAEDDHMGFNASKEELHEMDHEIFEPLNSFDDDVRELLIDAVNEKVRRILSLDPSKFQNGRLPFGLRPDKKTNAEEELENEIRRLLAKIVDLEEDRDRAKKEAEELRKMIEALMRRHGLTKDDLHGASLARNNTMGPEVPPPPTPAGRGRLTVNRPEKEPEEEDDKETKKNHKQREEELLMKIHQLEDALTLKKKENEDLRRRIFALENPPKDRKKPRAPGEGDSDDEEAGGKARKRLEATVQDLRDQIRKGEQEMKDARDRIKELERLLRDAQAPVVQVQEEAPPPAPIIQIDSHTARKSQELLQRLLLRAAKFLEVQASSKGQKAVEGILGLHPGEAAKSRRSATDESLPEKALPGFEEWTGEVLKAFDAYKPRQATPDAPTPVKTRKPVVPQEPEEEVAPRAIKEESPREGKCYKKEHKDVEKRMKELQDEISRLLLTIDELRRRIEQLQAVPMDPDTAEEVRSIMAKVGLQEMIDAAGSGHKLRGVFERLYQDAIQRIQRYGMVRERVLLANKAYSAVLAAIGGAKPEASTAPGAVPDFERLNETTQAALRGMWYNTDHLFRRACEYAMTQGVEASLLRVQKDPLKETEVGDIDFNLGEEDLRPKMAGMTRFKSADRLPGRRSERPSKAGFAATPTAKRPGVDTGPTSFTSYVAALREAQSAAAAQAEDLGASLPTRRRPDPNTPDHPKTLKAACTVAAAGPAVAGSLASSKSLPALPRGRGVLQGMADGELPASPLSFAASQATLVDTRVL